MRPLLLCLCPLIAVTAEDLGRPPSHEARQMAQTVNLMPPLTVTEAQQYTVVSQIIAVREKEGTLLDTAELKPHGMIVHSITYLQAGSGQWFAVVNLLRPRQPAR